MRIIDIQVSKSRDYESYKIIENRLLKYKTDFLCSDCYSVYESQIVASQHIQSKAETSLVESKNSSFRDNLARLNRKTKKYSKSIDMLELSVFLLAFFKNFHNINFF